MRLNGISIKMFTKILFKIPIFKKYEISGIFCKNKFQYEENLEKIPCKVEEILE